MGYTKHAIRGAGWNGALQVATTVLAAVKIVVLARILTPNDFGLFALVVITLGILEATSETGINPTIIQSEKSISYFLDTAWVISLIRGLLISILMILMGFVLRSVYQSEQLLTLVGLAALIPIIKGFINPAIVTLQKDFRFFRDTVYRFLVLVVEASSTIVIALLLRSVFAMVLGLIVSASFEVVLTWLMFNVRPRLNYISSRAREIFTNMKGLNILSILGYASENVDSLIVGKVVGTSGLGIYQNSYGFTHKLNLQLAKSVQHGTFPVYARMSNDQPRLRRAYLRTVSTSIGIFTVIAIPFFLFPELTVSILLGDKWLEAVPLIRPLLIAGIIQSVAAISSSLLVSRRAYFWMNANLLMTVVSMAMLVFILGTRYGLIGAVIGVLLSRAMALPISLFGVYQTLYKAPTPVARQRW
ncbi:oligosaccharide flippase family protein [Patescibacteria group bacterium]|nr:oligosaccharide flippase family protein [Patescibacteria group bacterium]